MRWPDLRHFTCRQKSASYLQLAAGRRRLFTDNFELTVWPNDSGGLNGVPRRLGRMNRQVSEQLTEDRRRAPFTQIGPPQW